MKVRVSTVLDNASYLYPRDEFEVVKSSGANFLLEAESGARRWVHRSFLRNLDGSFCALAAIPSPASKPEVTDEMVERARDAYEAIAMPASKLALRAALTAALTLKVTP